MNRVGGDDGLFTQIIQLFLSDCPERLAETEAAVEAKNPERIRLAAHALKGSAGNLSAIALASAARTLERIGSEGRIDAAPAAFRQLAADAVLAMDVLRQWVPAPVVAS